MRAGDGCGCEVEEAPTAEAGDECEAAGQLQGSLLLELYRLKVQGLASSLLCWRSDSGSLTTKHTSVAVVGSGKVD